MFVVCGEALMDVFGRRHARRHGARCAHRRLAVQRGAWGWRGWRSRWPSLGRLSRGFARRAADARAARRGRRHLAGAAQRRADHARRWSALDAHGVPSYAFYGDGCADRQLTHDALAALPPAARVLQFGSYATGGGAGRASTLRALVGARARARADRLRPEHPPQRRARPRSAGATCCEWMASRAHLLKVSDEDLAPALPGRDARAGRGTLAGAGRGAGGGHARRRRARAPGPPTRRPTRAGRSRCR